MLSAYVISFILLLGGVRISDVYILNSVGESTPLIAELSFLLLLVLILYCCIM